MIRELIHQNNPVFLMCESVNIFKQFLVVCINEGIKFEYYNESLGRFDEDNLTHLINEYKVFSNLVIRGNYHPNITIIVFYMCDKIQIELECNGGRGINLTQLFRSEKLNTIL